ncbi:MAG: PTS system mannose/fructose/sorbose family transporter subunit IID [Eubacterium sp.]
MKKESNELNNKLTNKDLTKLGLRSMMYQTGFNFEKMQAGSFGWCLIPGLNKIYGKDNPEVGKAISTYGLDFINTEQHAASFLMGLVLSMEENKSDRQLIRSMKTGLFGSLAGIGDAIFWFTLLPISGSIAASLCGQHSVLGPLFFFGFWVLMALSRVLFLKAGYKLGNNAITMLTSNAQALTKAAGILGVMVVGAMVPSYVTFAFPEELKLFGTVGVQSIFDSIMPSFLPAVFVGVLYFIFKKKKVSIVALILGIILFSILMALLGWM